MPPQAEIERLELEADTIVTRYQQVERALERARNESGDHWDEGNLEVTLETPQGETIDVILDLHADPATNAESRYDRVAELEAERERRRRIDDRMSPLPADPVAYLICYHLDAVEGNYPRSMAGHLDTQRDRVESLCEEMERTGLLERVESGTVKQRRVKAKQADEVRQHHTYYRLSRDGDHLLRFLSEREGQVNVVRHLPDGELLLGRLVRDGPDAPRLAADALDVAFEEARHRYRALRRVGLVTEWDGETTDAAGRSQPDGTRHEHTYYTTTDRGTRVLEELDG